MIIALDLEGTLISNAVSRIPRDGLSSFLEGCRELGRVVVFTSVPESLFRSIAAELADRGEVPTWFEALEYVRWSGQHKRVGLIPGADNDLALLVDDMPVVVHPDDQAAWIRCEPFEPPYHPDRGLDAVLTQLRTRARSS